MFAEGFPTYLFICTNSTIFLSILTVFILFGRKIDKKHQQNINQLIDMLKEQE